jgi:excisionase family DNA binding protein
MQDQTSAVLTIDELSVYLKIPKSSLYKLVRGGRVPCQKIGRHWRFRKEAIDRWLDESRPDGSANNPPPADPSVAHPSKGVE